jgi:gamma-glutamylcysteine synthetase
VSDATPLSARSELIEWFSAGEKPHDAFAIGTEHEKVRKTDDAGGRAAHRQGCA